MASRDDLMHVARAIKQHKEVNLRLGKALLENHFPGAREWATMLEYNNENLTNLFNLILTLNGPLSQPTTAEQHFDTGEDLTMAGVILAHIQRSK